MYANGDGVPKDSFEAVKWYRKAAEQGHADAQYNLGLAYRYGRGVPKDDAEAVKWYWKAAEQGDAEAQGNLGSMYFNGTGVSKDAIEGLAWSNIAAASGIEIYVKNRNGMERVVGPQATLAAQQRSKQILKEIKPRNARELRQRPKIRAPQLFRQREHQRPAVQEPSFPPQATS